MNFIRRHFYDLTTGHILSSYMMQGDIEPPTAEQEAEICGLSNWGLFEWTESNEEVEKNFMEAANITVDVSKEPHELVFDFTPLPEPEPEPEPESEPDYRTYYEAVSTEIEGGTE